MPGREDTRIALRPCALRDRTGTTCCFLVHLSKPSSHPSWSQRLQIVAAQGSSKSESSAARAVPRMSPRGLDTASSQATIAADSTRC